MTELVVADAHRLSEAVFKSIEYGQLTTVRVLYAIIDNRVLFTALNPGGASVNWAEEIIEAICAQEEIRYQDYRFFDLQTALGYRSFTEEDMCLDLLVIRTTQKGIEVTSWVPIAASPHLKRKQPAYRLMQELVPGPILEILREHT